MRLIARYLTAGLLAAALMAGWLAASPAQAQGGGALPATCSLSGLTRTCSLWAKSGTIGLPGNPSVPVWSYTDSAGGAPRAVGPTLVAAEGETLVINLTNTLGEATSLQIPGLAGPADMLGVAPNGGAASYSFPDLPAGTYIYQAGIITGSGSRQIAMGMAGALVVHSASAGSAYGTPATAFDDEAVLVYSEIDPAFNASPSTFVLKNFSPAYLLINGAAYPSTAAIDTAAGRTLLLRQVNAGIRFHSTGALGLRQSVIADDGAALANPLSVVSRTIGAGQTMDSLLRIPAGAADMRYPFYETGLPAHGSPGANGMGGLLTFIVAGAGSTTPSPTPSPTTPPADTAAPVVSGVTIAAVSNSTTTLPLTAGASDNVGVVSATYRIDGGAPAAFILTPGASVSLSADVNVSALGNGAHTVSVQAADAAGNQSNVGAASFTIDRVAPTVSSASLSPNPVAPGAAVALRATVSDSLSGIASASYRLDGGAAVPLTVGAGGSVQAAIGTAGMAVGSSHSVVVTAIDRAGNSGSSAALSFTISDTLFTSGFESPTTQPYGWSSVGGTASRLSLVTSGPIAGARSLRAAVSGGSSGYVQQSLGGAQTALHARVYLNPAGLTYTSNATATTARTILRGLNGSSEAFRLELRRTAATSGNFEVRAVVSRQNGSSATGWQALGAGASYVELAWAQGASSQLQIYTNGTLRQTLTGLATTAYSVSSIRLGPQGSLTGVGGSVLFDNVKITRTSLIGATN